MAQKTKSSLPPKPQLAAIVSGTGFRFIAADLAPLIGSLLYFVVHFLPDFDGYDAMGIQWVYMVGIDAVIALYILGRKNDYLAETAAVFSNTFSKLYLAFFALAGISIITAINPTESCVCFVRLIATIVAYFNISILLKGRIHLFKLLAQILSMILLFESYQTISQFLNGYSNTPLTELIMGLKGTAGNKNIFAAGLVIKIPFVLYCIYQSKLIGKIVHMIVLALGTLSIFLVNARASYLSLVVIVFLFLLFIFIQYFKDKKIETSLYRTGSVLIPILIAFFVSQLLISNATSMLEDKEHDFGSVTERIASIAQTQDESNQVRFRLWKHAIDYTEHHPFTGCGIGNWKIASIPYQRIITNDLYVPVHAHNDFLEVFAETGIIGGLVYLGLFVCLLIFTYRTFYSEASEETKLVSVFSFLAIITYMVDAMFNFPIERPISQVFFAFPVALNVVAFLEGIKEQNKEKPARSNLSLFKPVYGMIALLLLIPSFYITFLTYKSLIVQKSVLGDLNNEPLKLDWKTVVPSFPSIPNLSATAQPIESIKGRYMYEAGPAHYEEALVLLNKGRAANPVIGYSEFLKAGLYFKKDSMDPGKHWLDSANANATFAFYLRPKAKTYYQTLIAVLAKMRDTTDIQKAFREYDRYRHHAFGWDLYLRGMINSDKSFQQEKKLRTGALTSLQLKADSALLVFPGDSDLISRKREIADLMNMTKASENGINLVEFNKYYALGVSYFNGNGKPGSINLEAAGENFLKAHAINPADIASLENAAICFFNLRQYPKAIVYFDKELAMKRSGDGKPEYFKGIALINLGKKEEGCGLMQAAKAKNYPGSDAILKSNCGK